MSSCFLFLGVTAGGSVTLGSIGVWELDNAFLDGTGGIVAGGVNIGGLEKGIRVGADGVAVWRSLDLFVTNSLKNWVEVSGSYIFRGGRGCSCKAFARDDDD